MKKTTALMLMLAAALGFAADETGPGKIRWSGDDKAPKVEATGSVLLIDDDDAMRNTPRGSIAGMVTLPNKKIEWTPSLDPSRSTGGARLCDAVLAPDESAIAILERVGAGEGPFGSRVVFLNLFNSRLANVLTAADRKLSRIAILPGSGQVLALQEAQPDLGQSPRLVLLSVRHPGEIIESAEFGEPASDWVVAGDQALVKLADSNKLLIFRTDRLGDAPREVNLRWPGGLLFVSADGRVLINVTDRMIEYRKIDGDEFVPWKVQKLPENFKADFGAVIGRDGESLVIGQSGSCAYFVHGDAIREISSRSGRGAVWNESEKMLVLSLDKNDSLGLVQLPSQLAVTQVTPAGKLRPATLGEVSWIFCTSGNNMPVWVVDHRANVYKMNPTGRRWNKEVIYRADAGLK
ncbi:MAG: hypothetical protein AB7F32_01075 [Victivallaceae bacterium]